VIWLKTGASGALVNTIMNLGVAYNFGKFLSSSITGGFSRHARLHKDRQVKSAVI
jgi:hypothetical protein